MSKEQKMVSAPPYIGPEPLVGRYYPAKCRRCGWVGSSEELTEDDAQCPRQVGDRLCLGDCDELDSHDLLGIIQAMAQTQGEPAAFQWRCKTVNDGSQWRHWVDCTEEDYDKTIENPGPSPRGIIREARRLYAERHAPVTVVPELTSELRWILGQMCFQHIHTAQALRLMGHQIARKAEDEQAVTIYWMLGHYLKDPANWRENATAEMKAAAPAR